MRTLTISMHREGELLSLSAIVDSLGAQQWRCQICEFYGIGIAPNNMPMTEFEAQVRVSPHTMSWEELREFAAGIEQVWDCMILAFDQPSIVSIGSTPGNDVTTPQATIEAHDSSTWHITLHDELLLQQVANALSE